MKVVTCPSCKIRVGITNNECPSCRTIIDSSLLPEEKSEVLPSTNPPATELIRPKQTNYFEGSVAPEIFNELMDYGVDRDTIRIKYWQHVRTAESDKQTRDNVKQSTLLWDFVPRWIAMGSVATICILGLAIINNAVWATPIDHNATFLTVAITWAMRIIFPVFTVGALLLLFFGLVLTERLVYLLVSRAKVKATPEIIHDICKLLYDLELIEFVSFLSQREMLLRALEKCYQELEVAVNMTFVRHEIDRLQSNWHRASNLKLIDSKTGKDHYERYRKSVHGHLRYCYPMLLKALPYSSGEPNMLLPDASCPPSV